MALDVGGRHARGGTRVRVAARDATPRAARGTRTTSGDDREGPHARHQRHLLRRRTACGTTTCRPATRTSSRSSSRSSNAASTSRSTPAGRDRRDRVGRRPNPIDKGALLTGSSSIYASLRCAIAIAERLGRERPDWELSLGSLAIAIAHRPDALPRQGPLGDGLVLPDPRRACCAATRPHARVAAYWDTFVVPGRGVRCVSDQPVGHRGGDLRAGDGARRDRARTSRPRPVRLGAVPPPRRRRLLDRHELRRRPLRRPTASYYTAEQPTWNWPRSCSPRTRSAVRGPTAGLFRGEGLPVGLSRRGAHRGRGRDRAGAGRGPPPGRRLTPRASHDPLMA